MGSTIFPAGIAAATIFLPHLLNAELNHNYIATPLIKNYKLIIGVTTIFIYSFLMRIS